MVKAGDVRRSAPLPRGGARVEALPKFALMLQEGCWAHQFPMPLDWEVSPALDGARAWETFLGRLAGFPVAPSFSLLPHMLVYATLTLLV